MRSEAVRAGVPPDHTSHERIRRRAMATLRQEVEPDEAGLDVKALDRLDQACAHLVDEGRLPGFLVAVARGGRVAHLTTHGRRDVAADLPVEADTLWRIYSMTKPVTSVA